MFLKAESFARYFNTREKVERCFPFNTKLISSPFVRAPSIHASRLMQILETSVKRQINIHIPLHATTLSSSHDWYYLMGDHEMTYVMWSVVDGDILYSLQPPTTEDSHLRPDNYKNLLGQWMNCHIVSNGS